MCITCGGPRPPHRKYCSDRCMYARPSKPYESWAVRRERAERRAEIRMCRCGAAFRYVKKLREKYCSARCSSRYSRPPVQPKVCEWRCEIPWQACSECRTPYRKRGKATYCSDECRKAQGRRRYRETFVSVAVTNPVVSHVCPECGSSFTTRRYSATRIFCSYLCRRRVGKRLRRHALRSRPYEQVGLWEIGERDGWVCQLCRKPVDRTLSPRHKWAKTLDHIVPVLDGGCHVRTNLQLAHRTCNSRKGVGPAQLRWAA